MNLVSVMLRRAAELADAPALVYDDRGVDKIVTYAELEALAANAAGSLARLGVAPGDRVAIASENDEAFVVAYLATLWAGAVAVPLNPHSPAPELRRELAQVTPKLVVYGPSCTELGELPDSIAYGALPAGPPMAVEAERDEDEPAVLLFTSGTAGHPKAAVLTHGNLEANIGQVLGVLPVGEDDVGLASLPFFHVFGLNVALGVGLASGLRTVLLDHFRPARAAELIRRHRVTIFAGVPTMYAAFLELDAATAPPDTFSSLRIVVSGAAALPEEVAQAFTARFGMVIHEGYGLTEAAPIVSTSAIGGAPRAGSIGPPLPGLDVRLVGDDGDDVVAGDPGEIWVRGPNVFPGYWQDPEATERVLFDGWLRTGDIAVADDDGYLHLVDRAKDLVIVSGFNVYPVEVEQALLEHPAVVDAAVLGEPHPRTGETLAAWVVLAEGATVTPDDLRDHVAEQLARYKVPARVEIVDALPRNEAGKLIRRELRSTEGERLATRKPA